MVNVDQVSPPYTNNFNSQLIERWELTRMEASLRVSPKALSVLLPPPFSYPLYKSVHQKLEKSPRSPILPVKCVNGTSLTQ